MTESSMGNGATPDEERPTEMEGEEDPTSTAAASEDTAEPSEAEDTADDSDDNPLALAEAEITGLKDKLLRAMAETENVRRRAQRESADARQFAIADFARDVLTVSDNLQRALAAIPEDAGGDNAALAGLLEGVDLTQKMLTGMLEKHGIAEVDPMGEKLDPNLHQAMLQIDDSEADAGTVVQVLQVGYTINGRLLRPAMVGVAKGGNGDENDPSEGVDTSA